MLCYFVPVSTISQDVICNVPISNYWVTIEVLAEGCIDPSYHRLTQLIWNDLNKFRTGPRTTPTVSAMDPPLLFHFCFTPLRFSSAKKNNANLTLRLFLQRKRR